MLSRPFTRFVARLRAAVGSDAAGLRQALAALLVSSGGDLLAGLTLGAITGTLEALPGLLVLVPAAIGMRGNIFGALGSRLGTSIHTGTFSLSRRRDTVVGQNVVTSLTSPSRSHSSFASDTQNVEMLVSTASASASRASSRRSASSRIWSRRL